jgi:DNA-binding GntR family transcriptional regulator
MTSQLERRALVDQIAATLQARMLRGELPAGKRLRQESLAAEFGVSRTPVREALRKLEASSLVQLEPNRGAVVRGPTAREIKEAYVVRAELEGLAAELAAQRIREDELERLRESLALFHRSIGDLIERRRTDGVTRESADIDNWTRANDGFHQGIQNAAGIERLKAILFDLHLSFPRNLTGVVLSQSTRLLQENVRQHAAILEAIEAHDGTRARRRMIDHVRRSGELVTLRFEQQSG